MRISRDSFKTTPYFMPSFEYTLRAAVRPQIGQHIPYDPALIRGTITTGAYAKGLMTISSLVVAAAGETIYLPWKENHITSTVLPNPAPAGVYQFITAGMSGCKFFVDTITGSTNLLVYHANAKMHSSPLGSALNHQSNTAITYLDTTLHTAAQGDYLGAPYLLTAVNAAEIGKQRYYQSGADEVLRKQGQGRLQVEIDAGVALMAFWRNNHWEFWWQVFGDTEYDRPVGAKPLLAKPRGKTGTHKTSTKMKVLECRKFYTSV